MLLSQHPNDIQLRRKYAMVLLWSGAEEKAAEELEKTLEERSCLVDTKSAPLDKHKLLDPPSLKH